MQYFFKEVPFSQNRNHRLLALFRDDGELDLPSLDIEDGVSRLALRENLVVFRVAAMRLSFTDLGQKTFGVENTLAGHRQFF